MSSKDSKAYIGGDPLPRPDTSDRGERGTPTRPKAHKRAAQPKASPPKTISLGKLPQPKAPNYRAPDNYSTYGRPGTNDMGPSSRAKTINLGKLPPATAGDLPSTGKSDFASRFGKGTVSEDMSSQAGEAIQPTQKQSKHGYKVKWS